MSTNNPKFTSIQKFLIGVSYLKNEALIGLFPFLEKKDWKKNSIFEEIMKTRGNVVQRLGGEISPEEHEEMVRAVFEYRKYKFPDK